MQRRKASSCLPQYNIFETKRKGIFAITVQLFRQVVNEK